MAFYCNGKKGVCDNDELCDDCEFWDGKAGKVINTNADKIRAMNDFELRQFICANNRCETCRWSAAYGCKLMEWLKEPAEEGE